ncbi:P-loop containing nucleoside triphosphate hydrolase [Pseudocohnilembus persalinus]|uniref:p-loop containing nucleoside triphosphate hydrolase n=1 Tax=Pseudocohnilembus persalinus TaxID=266149 RepID=A0A0V0R8G4_PSEPJ|nr:P-loop containing nucleoside triphosphate hydrolase [Pseudocohnilembus persalinus]|eukprot:KRX10672.1 P-loop containing nucleoside triphosphate hydrolase [Pseudocohnilembus persalinus]
MSEKVEEYFKPIKFLIIGDSNVGKTNCLLRFCGQQFTNNHLSTIGVDCQKKTVIVENTQFKLQIWDTAGQERFNIITQQYYKNAMGIVMAYSVTDKQSFQNIEKWMEQIKDGAPENVCIVLIGNKCDLYTERQVTLEQGQQLADFFKIPFFETSALENTNIDNTFLTLTKIVKKNIIDTKAKLRQKDQELQFNKLGENNKKKEKKSCC